MTRDEKIAEARRLRAKGLFYREIGERLGVTSTAVEKWCKPEWAKEKAQKSNAKRNAAKRKWEDAKRARCPQCGRAKGSGSALRGGPKATSVCAQCFNRKARERAELFIEMRRQGKSNVEIAAEQGTTPQVVATCFLNAKRRWSLDIPVAPYFRRAILKEVRP